MKGPESPRFWTEDSHVWQLDSPSGTFLVSKKGRLKFLYFILHYIPKDQRESWKPGNDFFARFRTPKYVVYQKRYWAKALELVGAMHRASVPTLAGTDLGTKHGRFVARQRIA
jgi:hypothetical protein